MFPSPTIDRPARRSVKQLVRGALGTAIEFATLGEASLASAPAASAATQPTAPSPLMAHPHRQALVRPRRPRRDGAVPPRAPVCTASVPKAPTAVS